MANPPGDHSHLIDFPEALEALFSRIGELKLVLGAPHITLRGTEKDNRTYFVDVFTWRDASIPDAAPPAILAIWADMNRLVEARGGRPGLDIAAVSIVAPSAIP